MGITYFDLSTSLDGYIAGPNVGPDNPMGDGGEQLHDWMFAGKTAEQARAFEEESFAPTGAMVMGRRMLDLGIGPWGDNPTFHMPVFVLTHRPHEPIVKDGGTTYHFVTSGLADGLEQARAAAGDKDISIAGGANIVQQCIAAAVVDEIRLHLVPVLLGAGVRLFDHLGPAAPADLWTTSVVDSDAAIHLRYRIRTEP